MTSPALRPQSVDLSHLGPKVTARALGGLTCAVQPYAPGSPVKGDLWFDTSDSYQLKQWTGANWQEVPLNAGNLIGQNFIISPAGMFFYSQPPALTLWGFESDAEGWTGSGGILVQSPQQARTGLYSAMLTYTSGTAWSAASPQVPLTAGTQAYASAWAYSPQALGAAGLQLAWYNSGGTLISTSSDSTVSLTAGTWTKFTFNATAPAGAVSVSVVVQDNEASTTGNQLFIDDVYLAGKLVISATQAASTDLLGNSVPAGYTAYGSNTATSLTNTGTYAGVLMHQTASTQVTTTPQVYAADFNTNAPGEYAFLGLVSGSVTGQDYSLIDLYSESPDSSQPATIFLQCGTLSQVWVRKDRVILWTPVARSDTGLTGYAAISQTSQNQKNVTTTSYSDLTHIWTIPPGDAFPGTVYRLRAWGSGQQSTSAATSFGFQVAGFGNSTATAVISSGVIPTGHSYSWSAIAEIVIFSNGGSGQALYTLSGQVSDATVNITSSNSVPFTANSGYVGTNTNPAVTMTIQGAIGATAGSCSITGFSSTLERLGP